MSDDPWKDFQDALAGAGTVAVSTAPLWLPLLLGLGLAGLGLGVQSLRIADILKW
jgi:hypothetical protein